MDDANGAQYMQYVERENTSFDLSEKIIPHDSKPQNGILVSIDGNIFNQQDFQYINQISEIISDSGKIGTFQLGNLSITIKNLKTYEKSLIKVS
jgi:hypothetical protein